MALKKVILHGYLSDLWDGPSEFEAETVAEAIKAFCLQTKCLDPTPGTPRHAVRVVGFDTPESMMLPTSATEIHIIPDFSGGKQGGFLQILIGAVLIGASFLLPGGPTWAIVAGLMFNIGVSLVLGGLMQLLSPAPVQDTASPDASRYLGTAKNTVAIGTRIPILYGERLVFGQYLSFDIAAQDTIKTGFKLKPKGKIWRVLVTQTKYLVDNPADLDVWNGVAIDNIELRGFPGGDNLAVHYGDDNYFADSWYLGNEASCGPQHAFGATPPSASRTSSLSFPMPHWVAYQFEVETEIHEIAMTCAVAPPPVGIDWLVRADYYPYDFKVQFSSGPLTPHTELGAAGAWTTVATITAQVWTVGPTTRTFNW